MNNDNLAEITSIFAHVRITRACVQPARNSRVNSAFTNQKMVDARLWNVLLAVVVFVGGYMFGTFHEYWKETVQYDQSMARNPIATQLRAQFAKAKVKTRVVMFVPTPIKAVQKRSFVYRQFLRERWNATDAVIFFVVGSKTGPRLEEDMDMTSVAAEQARGIPIIVTDCRDYGDEIDNANGTSSTTCKVYESVKYAYLHYDAEYLFRGADDAYVNLKHFFRVADAISPSRKPWWMGQVRVPLNPRIHHDLLLDKQPQLRKLYGLYMFGQYMLGCGYVWTWDVTEHVAKWTIPPHQTYAEDVIVGMWLNPFRIEWIDDEPNFTYLDGMRRWHEPSKLGILVHYVNTAEDWSSIDDEGRLHVSTGQEGTYRLPPLDHFLAGKTFVFPKRNITIPTYAPKFNASEVNRTRDNPHAYLRFPTPKPKAFPELALVRFNKETQVYIMMNGTLRGVPNLQTFLTLGRDFSEVQAVLDTEKPLYTIGEMLPAV